VLTLVRGRLPSDHRIAVLGIAEDKKVFMELLGGLVMPTAGRIIRKARVSFPAGYVGGFERDLSVRLNVAHVARLYGADIGPVVDFVARASELGEDFKKPYGDLAASQKRALSEILALSIPFDVYLLNDEIMQSKGKFYNKNARALFEARAKTSGMIIASQDVAFAREFCDMGLVLNGGQMRLFRNLERAFSFAAQATAATSQLMAREERQKERRKKATKLARKNPQE
jgi:capsular polysaccharide transport system ATP-binding protein